MLYLRYERLLCWTTNNLKERSFFPTSEELKGLFYHSYQNSRILGNTKNLGKSNGKYKQKTKEKIKRKLFIRRFHLAFRISCSLSQQCWSLQSSQLYQTQAKDGNLTCVTWNPRLPKAAWASLALCAAITKETRIYLTSPSSLTKPWKLWNRFIINSQWWMCWDISYLQLHIPYSGKVWVFLSANKN